jgi:hypothetical protein
MTRIVHWIRGHRIVFGGGSIAVVAAVVVAVLLAEPAAPAPVAYDNVSSNFNVCLATMANSATTKVVRDSIGAAQRKTPINAQTVTVPDGATAQLTPYVNSLVALRCGLVVAADERLRGAVTSSARLHPGQQFLYVGKAIELPNVHSTPTADPETLTGLVEQAAKRQP